VAIFLGGGAGPRPLWWACTPTASVEVTVSGIHNRLTYGVIVYSLNVKVKVMFTLEQGTKAQRRSIGIAILFL
jgi:hypothetical protein